MFTGSSGCQITGTEYTSKHQRLSLYLLPPGGEPQFTVAFTDVAAYKITPELGEVILAVYTAPTSDLISANWDQVLLATQSGLWPGPAPQDPADASALASRLALTGFTIKFNSGESAWAISRDFVLLGRRQRA